MDGLGMVIAAVSIPAALLVAAHGIGRAIVRMGRAVWPDSWVWRVLS